LNIRKRYLPFGWYPETKNEILSEISAMNAQKRDFGNAAASVSPHAGWAFCGDKIYTSIKCIPEDTETVIVLGGHIPGGMPYLYYAEDAWELPGGIMEKDYEFAEMVNSISLLSGLDIRTETNADNTVEVIMPMLQVLFPGVKWSAWRIPADKSAKKFGRILYEASLNMKRKIFVIGSTDLTHFGPSYGFEPDTYGKTPQEWVKENDMEFISYLLNMDADNAVESAEKNKSACSAGAAAAALSYAYYGGSTKGRLISYSTSYSIYPSDSFVGYASILWENR